MSGSRKGLKWRLVGRRIRGDGVKIEGREKAREEKEEGDRQ